MAISSKFLKFYRSYGLFFSIAVGCCSPFLHVISERCFAYFLMPMLFFVFVRIQAPFHAVRWSHVLFLLWNFLFPCGVFVFLRFLGFSIDFAMAGFMAAVTPTGTAAPVVMTFLRGNMEYVVMAFLLSTLVFTFAIPFMFPFFYGVPTPGLSMIILKKVAGVVLLPMMLAIFCRLRYPKSQEWGAKAQDFSFMMWQILIILICAQMSHSVLENRVVLHAIPQVFLISVSVCFLNFASGRLLGGKTYSRECSQALGQKNCSLTILVAIMYANPIVALGPSLYIMCHNTWNAIQIAHEQKARKQD
ncbi:MAG: hypothetical protein Q4C70_06200 [Planctomycetia bacterium]|nr:hypothetical protein [Planctomycetia bacterium]